MAALRAIAGCAGGSAWIFPTPWRLPAGAFAVPIDVQAIPSESSDVNVACAAALLGPAEIVVDRSFAPPHISYRLVDSGEHLGVRWSWGTSGYVLDGVVHIVAPDAEDLMVEGEVADGIGGGFGENDDVFWACDSGIDAVVLVADGA